MGYVNENEEVSRRLREHRAALKDVESQSTDKKVAKSRLETEIQNYLLRLNDAYAMTFEHAQEKPICPLILIRLRIKYVI